MRQRSGRGSARSAARGAFGAFVVVVAVGLGGAPALAQANSTGNSGNGTPGRVLPTSDPVPSQYIVTLRTPPAAAPAAAEALTRGHGGQVLETYSHALSGYAARMTDAQAQELSLDPAVDSVVQDGYVHATATQSPAPSWGLDRIDQHDLPLDNSYTPLGDGNGVTAYVIDTGIRYTNTDFGGRAKFGVDEIVPSTNGNDCYGHGTHVAGTIGGTTYGVAKAVTLVSVRVLDCNGSGSFAGVIAGVDWVTANHVSPAVANMSLGGGAYSLLDTAIANSTNSGVTYAVAAGNSNASACNYSPARAASAITVGATTSTDARASYSNYGTCVDIFAPGSGITSDWNTSDTATNVLDGTSMATPHVAGSAALYLGANPTKTPTEVATALVGAATTGHVTSAGTGSPNLLDYVGASGGSTPPPPPPPPPANAPGAPRIFASSAGRSLARINWTTPSNGGSPITGYKVYRSTSASGPFALRATLGVVTNFTDTPLTPGVRYYFRVSAMNAPGGEGPVSNTVSVTPRS